MLVAGTEPTINLVRIIIQCPNQTTGHLITLVVVALL